jgi:hypothetical protein
MHCNFSGQCAVSNASKYYFCILLHTRITRNRESALAMADTKTKHDRASNCVQHFYIELA